MKDFAFHRPATVAEAVACFAAAAEGKYLAGGQSLLPVMKLDLAQPTDLISLAEIADLRDIRRDGDRLILGALASHAEAARSQVVLQSIPGLAGLAEGIGDAQVRNRGTVGGSLAHADPAADYPAALLGLGGVIQTDRRRISADDFFTGLFETALLPGELITAVHLPIPRRCGYAKFANHASRYAVVGVLVAHFDAGVRVAVTGAGPVVFRVPEMEQRLSASFTPESLRDVQVPCEGLSSDLAAGASFRAHLIGVMARRAVAAVSHGG